MTFCEGLLWLRILFGSVGMAVDRRFELGLVSSFEGIKGGGLVWCKKNHERFGLVQKKHILNKNHFLQKTWCVFSFCAFVVFFGGGFIVVAVGF